MQFSSPFDTPDNLKITIDPEEQKLLRELDRRYKLVKRDTDYIRALKEKKEARDAAEMAENAKLVRDELAKYNKKMIEEATTRKIDNDENTLKIVKDLKNEVQQLQQNVCDLNEKLSAQNTSESTLRECHMNTESLYKVTEKTSSVYKSSKAFFEELIKPTSDVSANVTARGRLCGWVRNATNVTSSRPMPYGPTSAKKRPSVLKDAEYFPSESGESHGVSSNCQKCQLPSDDELNIFLSPKTSDFGSDGESCQIVNHDEPHPASCSRKPDETVNREEPIRLEISLADPVLQCVQNMALQNCRSNTICANQVQLEIKLDTLAWKVSELMSMNGKQNINDGRERSENATDASAAVTCTFTDCVCRLIEDDNVGTQGGSPDDCKNKGRDRHGLVKQTTEQCSGALDQVPKKIDHRSRPRVDKTNNCSSSKRSDKPNIANEEKKQTVVVQTERDRVATRSAVPLDQRFSDCTASMKQYVASASTRRGNDGSRSSDNHMKTVGNHSSACKYCRGTDGVHNDQVIRLSYDIPSPKKGQYYYRL